MKTCLISTMNMNIECQGCLYTVCSFICLTENLSEILEFLWKHGCLRKLYNCEKCGKRCAIGDKDLFFRCNRNLVEVPKPKKTLHYLQPSPSVLQNSNSISITSASVSMDGQVLHTVEYNSVNPSASYGASLTEGPLAPTFPTPVHFAPFTTSTQIQYADQQDRIEVSSSSVNHKESGGDSGKIIQCTFKDEGMIGPPDDEDYAELADLDSQANKTRKPIKSTSKKRCNFKMSMKKGTFFEKSKLPIDTVCKFVVLWCCMKQPTQEFLRNELGLATRTVVDWSMTCREICINWAKQNSEKIGGEGVVVQIDEIKAAVTKTDCGAENKFSYWGMEKDREKGKIFIVPVPQCHTWFLLNVILEWVLPGSVIVSNCWKAYDCMKLKEFMAQVTAHRLTLLHPVQNYGFSSLEEQVEDNERKRQQEETQMPRFGTRRSHHLGDMAEYMFKRRFYNHLERMHAFFRQVAVVLTKSYRLIANITNPKSASGKKNTKALELVMFAIKP